MKQFRALNLINELAKQGFDLNDLQLILESINLWSICISTEDIREALIHAEVQVKQTIQVQKAMIIS